MSLLLIASFPESLIRFRGPLIEALLAAGQTVHVAAPDLRSNRELCSTLGKKGVILHEIPLQRTGSSIRGDLELLLHLIGVMRKIRPRKVLGYTVKPVVYGTLAAWLTGVPERYALITGLGYAFLGGKARRTLHTIVKGMYRTSLRFADKVFFQNPDDEALFRKLGVLRPSTRSCVINGSGVEMEHFVVSPMPAALRFLLIARLLGDKGVREYVEAARQVRMRHPTVQFALVGWIDENPDAIKQAELESWLAEGVVDYLGRLEDVRPAIAACSVYVLPSYREGTPRTVLEAMAMGRAVITTDAPGCRETVEDGFNGFLVPVKAVVELAAAMLRFVEQPELIERMGTHSRQIAEEKYDARRVSAKMLEEMRIT